MYAGVVGLGHFWGYVTLIILNARFVAKMNKKKLNMKNNLDYPSTLPSNLKMTFKPRLDYLT